MPFISTKKNNDQRLIDNAIAKKLRELNITIPIVHIKAELYLVAL